MKKKKEKRKEKNDRQGFLFYAGIGGVLALLFSGDILLGCSVAFAVWIGSIVGEKYFGRK